MRVPLDSCLCGQPAGCGDGSMLRENETRGPLDLRGWFRTPDVIVQWHLKFSMSPLARIPSFTSLAFAEVPNFFGGTRTRGALSDVAISVLYWAQGRGSRALRREFELSKA